MDVHSRRVNACVRVADGRTVTTEHREFATTTAGLLDTAAWLTEAGCTHVAMEATGVYWKPVWAHPRRRGATLIQAAWAATRKNGSYLPAQSDASEASAVRRRPSWAVAASMLTAAYFMLRDETDYHDLGGRYLADRDADRVKQSLIRRLRKLGVVVEVKAA